MKKIKLFSLVAAALFAGSAMAASYIPTVVHEVGADEILYTANGNGTVTAGKTAGWIVIANESYKDQTPLDLDGTKLSSSTSCLQVKNDGNVFNSSKRVIHLLVTGITGVVASGSASSGRGFQIGATEYTEGMSEGTEMNVVAGSVARKTLFLMMAWIVKRPISSLYLHMVAILIFMPSNLLPPP